MDDPKELTSMVGIDGGLRRIPAYLSNDLQKKGWRIVLNPKRNYYPEYDQTSPHYHPTNDPEKEITTLYVDVI